jgi:hypothetical protein
MPGVFSWTLQISHAHSIQGSSFWQLMQNPSVLEHRHSAHFPGISNSTVVEMMVLIALVGNILDYP